MADGDTSPEPQPVQKSETRREGRDLNTALAACFSVSMLRPTFPERLAEFVGALTNAPGVSVWSFSGPESEAERLAGLGVLSETEKLLPKLRSFWDEAPETEPTVKFSGPHVMARVALPGGETAVLAASVPAGGPAAQGILYERVSLLANLSFAQFRNPDSVDQQSLAKAIKAVAKGDRAQLQTVADTLAQMSGADFAALALWRDGAVFDVTISGQDSFTKRAALPASVSQKLRDTVLQNLSGRERVFAQTPAQNAGLVMYLQDPQRAPGLLDIAAGYWATSEHAKPRRRLSQSRLVKIGAFSLILIGLGLVPISDGANVPATVEAVNKRLLTAPFTTIIAQSNVEDGVPVAAGDVLVRLDTRELDLELVSLQSERASAVIEREAARAVANAAELRNAEISVERLDAQIELLQLRKASAVLSAPIDGITVLGDLDQRVGTTVRQGDTLAEVVDPRSLTLRLDIPENDIGRLSAGDTGRFRPDYDPTLIMESTLVSISPAIDDTQEIPIAQATARFDEDPQGLRPGLQGVFQSGETYTPIWQVLYNNLRDWVLLRVWF